MRIFEFAGDDPLRVKLAAIAKQLQTRAIEKDRPMDTDEFLRFLNDSGISLELSDLFDIVQKEPLSNIVQSVNKDQVIFKGQKGAETTGTTPDKSDAEKVRQQMARKAMK
jgi:hypothetical protein